MTFRLRTVQTTAQGRAIVRDRNHAGERVSVGRAADNVLHLPDLALDPYHAELIGEGDGRVTVRALGSIGFTLDGRPAHAATIDPQTGGELRFGGYRVALSQDSDGAVLLSVVEAARADDSEDELRAFTLARRLPGKRLTAWLLSLATLIGFLAVPVYSALTRGPAAKQGVSGDAAWSSGPLSLAHHQLEGKCEACHVKPFEAVRDETCQTCHKDVHEHAVPTRLSGARGPGSLGERVQWNVAHLFGKPGPGACSDCHTEHEGGGKMPPPAQAFCADCHGSLKDRLTDTRLGNAADFATLHPQFRPRVALTMGSDKLTRVSLDQRPREASGLTFPHDLHLDRRGGVARMGQRLGMGASLDCQDCHRPDADGVRMLPIKMERDCEGCHSLAYDRVGSTFRKLRHGDVDQMIADLSVAPRGATPIVTGRRRPGDFANGGAYFARFAAAAASPVSQALSRDGICGECHTSAGGGRFAVMPVTQVSRFFDHGWFSHAAHKQEKCSSCHAAARSTASADLLLPDLKSCRTCHAGEKAPRGKISSGCAMCHDYHLTAQAPRGLDPGRKP